MDAILLKTQNFLQVCVIVCLIKRNRGGKYAVQEREERQGRRDPYDEGGFPEYTQP
jgi:hypothetical protein